MARAISHYAGCQCGDCRGGRGALARVAAHPAGCQCGDCRGGGGRGALLRASAVAEAGAESVEAEVPVEILESHEDEELLRLRHTSAHVLAMAVQKMWPGTQVTIGPWTDNGFYYDFDVKGEITDKDLKKIQKEMGRICKKRMKMTVEEVTPEEAERRIRAQGEPYKLEILESILERDPNAPITIWHTGEPGEEGSFWDLCAGPHVEDTGKINPKALMLESVAGAYWRGDEKRAMLTRVYGTVFKDPKELKAYKKMCEEAKKRDHRMLGQKLDLFSIQEEAGGGLVFWHPKGAMAQHLIKDFWTQIHLKGGYDLVASPHIARQHLWETSGHLDFYADGMFNNIEVEGDLYRLKPMNCPFHIKIYQDRLRSYRELPLRWAELGTVYRYERSGTLHGLMRVRGFTQDDAHIFCLSEQLAGEIRGVLDLVEETLSAFGFSDYEVNLSTRPEKSVGLDVVWEQSEAALEAALGAKGWDFAVDEGGGAFYGPKIDIKVRDAIGRKWQCSTIQVDFNLPERFGMEYVDSEGERQQPIMVHRAIFGSLERFFGILLESCEGNFPLWIAPVQLQLLAVSEEVVPHCERLAEKFREQGLRVDVASGERLGKLIRNAETARLPLMAVVGDREVADGTLSLRSWRRGDLGSMDVAAAEALMLEAVAAKAVV